MDRCERRLCRYNRALLRLVELEAVRVGYGQLRVISITNPANPLRRPAGMAEGWSHETA